MTAKRLSGNYDFHEGKLNGFAFKNANGLWVFEGTFKQNNYHQQGYARLEWDDEISMFLGVWNYVDQIHGELNGVRVGDPPAPPASGFNLSTEYRETLYMAFPDAQHPYPRLMYQNAAHHPSQEVFTFEPTKVMENSSFDDFIHCGIVDARVCVGNLPFMSQKFSYCI
eukprot:TRINITY_DN824_c0_g1_i16.p2 TRINITY_DN824_c0_g1~~TRINITY_DN824_c0_g1_i16.p2  ORF type:complete len:168 (+),score=58.69 TRINITY_DN824_c0_g1_i16:440-943(+)